MPSSVFVRFFFAQATLLLALSGRGNGNDTTILREHFTDSVHIGKKGQDKIEFSRFGTPDTDYVVLKFYTRSLKYTWVLKQKFAFKVDGSFGCHPRLSDFNNDGFGDFTYISALAARGANEVRRLFIYNVVKDDLQYIKNSEDYPNMLYNKELNCVDAFLVYGGSSTVFLKIRGDSLKEFAGVDLNNGLTVYEMDKKGNKKIIKQDSTASFNYVRFRNYKPLRRYETY